MTISQLRFFFFFVDVFSLFSAVYLISEKNETKEKKKSIVEVGKKKLFLSPFTIFTHSLNDHTHKKKKDKRSRNLHQSHIII